MNPIPADLTEIDLTDPQTFLDLDPIEMWRRFRAERPVHRHRAVGGAPGFWAVNRHADLMSVYRDNKRFTSERGNVLATLLLSSMPTPPSRPTTLSPASSSVPVKVQQHS